ncbi:MAG TPA: Crp/Fnr family transcriptional regulator [Lutibacter sp.]|nr:Crp/Fnr family transcriptional regulator [Lutibacter sp.]
MASLSALIQNKKANLALECLTDCTLIEVNWESFMELAKTNPEIGIFYRKVLEERFVRFELSNIQLATMTATERYVELRKRCPDIEKQVSQLNIASFIGITPVQLSRIRKKLFST